MTWVVCLERVERSLLSCVEEYAVGVFYGKDLLFMCLLFVFLFFFFPLSTYLNPDNFHGLL